MDQFFEYLNSNSVLALIVAASIFIITLVLVIKRLIGFFITLLLLAFTIVSGYAVYNNDLVRDFLKQKVDQNRNGITEEQPTPTFQEKIQDAYEKLKVELEIQKEKLQEYLNRPKDEKKSDEHLN
jgi:predicted membrane protein